MRPLTPVLHTAPVNGKTVRFYRSPLNRPDTAWHNLDDLHAALGVPRGMRREFAVSLRNGSFAKDIKTIATADGIVTIAPHYMAHGIIDASVKAGRAPESAEQDYRRAMSSTSIKITAGMSEEKSFSYLMAAFKYGSGAE
jgi:hypothetical protein